jgi:hypothetical protein
MYHSTVPLALLRGATLAMICVLVVACSSDDDAPPVAEPSVIVPERATAGRPFDVTYRFVVPAGAPALSDDYTVFVHVMDESATRLWTGDHEPPTPTSQWREGSVIEYTRPMRVPRSVTNGRVTLQLGLYLPETGERLPLSGERVARRSYRVAAFDVTSEPAGQQDVFFTDGWHGLEAPVEAQGLEWRWSGRDATVWLRNPKRDSVVVIELDQLVTLGTSPQQVEVRVGSHVVDSFAVPPSQHLVRRVSVPVAMLGHDEFAQLTLHVDRTFVPAQLGQAAADQRELGVRVFSIAIEQMADESDACSPP